MGTPAAFSQAVSVAAAEGQNASGGPWTIVAAEGLGVGSGGSQANAEFVGSGGCTFTPVAGGASLVTVLGTPLGATPGEVATWVFLAKNASLNVILMGEVNDGQASLGVFVTGCSWVGTFASLGVVSGASDIDSTTVATDFDENGGSSFLLNHTVSTQLFVVVGGSSSTDGVAAWEVMYSTCSLFASGGNGTWLSGYYNAETGSVIQSPTLSSGAC